MRTLHWFRSDLRLDDNTALDLAHQAGDCLGLFLLAPVQWRQHDFSAAKVGFLLANLRQLAADCDRIGLPLLIRHAPRFADAPQALLAVCREFDIDRVLWNQEYEVDEQARDAVVGQTLNAAGIGTMAPDDQTVLPPDAVRTAAGGPYSVFTPYKRRWLQQVQEQGFHLAPRPGKRRRSRKSDPIPEQPDWPASTDWPVGETAAMQKLSGFLDQGMNAYHDQRDHPALAGTSRLSPYLTLGIISPRRCVAAAQSIAGNGPATWLSELIWRELYRQVLVAYPRVCRNRAFKTKTDTVAWRNDPAGFQAWCDGQTGIPIVDAGMRELRATGWMHNRVRMITAMFLSKNLLLDWRQGERFFMQHLIDGDLASNNGGWQWSASTGTDAAPYFRVFNPVSQSKRFDPDGDYLRRWLPELQGLDTKQIHDPPAALRGDYPAALVDLKQTRQRAIEAFKALA